ncbi:MAG: aspartyl protease family protein [Lysobacterales bacterium]
MKHWLALGMGCLVSAAAGAAEPTAQSLLAQQRERSGGERWESVAGLHWQGQIAAGGLAGEISATEDLREGRYRTLYQLGPARGGDGWDGEQAWTLHSDGAVVAIGQTAVLQRNRTDQWMSRRGYLAPDLLGAQAGPVTQVTVDGEVWQRFTLTPVDGAPVEFGFAADGWLRELRSQIEGRTITTRLEDYRAVAGLQLPFRLVVDEGDPRLLSEVQWAEVSVLDDDKLAAQDLAAPTASIDFRFTDGQPVDLPFELINNHIYVQVEVNGQPLRLLFDTGGVNLLTPKAAERLGLSSSGQLAARGVGEKAQDVGFAQAEQLRIGTFELDQPLFYVIDLGPMMGVEGMEFDGLVGFEVFKRAIVQIDYPARRLRLYPEGSAQASGHTLPFVLDERIPVIEGQLDGLPLRISIDTGSRAALTVHSPFARRQQLEQQKALAAPAINGWGVGGGLTSQAFRIDRLQLGAIAIDGVTADMYLGDKGAFANNETDANLGSGLLKAFVATFDYARQSLTLAPGPDGYQDDGYDRIGAWLNLADDDTLAVAAVTADGPADQAGLKPGDHITALADQPVGSRSLADWRAWSRQLAPGVAVQLVLADGRSLSVVPRVLIPAR